MDVVVSAVVAGIDGVVFSDVVLVSKAVDVAGADVAVEVAGVRVVGVEVVVTTSVESEDGLVDNS